MKIIIKQMILETLWISDYKAGEFHITPVLTYSWAVRLQTKGYGIALEWGCWAVLIYVAWLKKDNNNNKNNDVKN